VFLKENIMRSHIISISLASVLCTTAAAGAQQASQSVRIAGTVKSATATGVVLATDKGDVDIAITPQTRVLIRKPATASEIKAGAYLGTANQTTGDGTGTANEVHLMDMGPNVNSPMNKPGLMMTNGHVKSVTHTAKGDELDIDYGQAQTRHVIVSKGTTMTRMVDVGVAGLKPGVEVSANTMTGANGKPTANFISVSTPAK
jgi:hypothetical protein